jgi:hypothetical protein
VNSPITDPTGTLPAGGWFGDFIDESEFVIGTSLSFGAAQSVRCLTAVAKVIQTEHPKGRLTLQGRSKT